jgi:hypothetical protein
LLRTVMLLGTALVIAGLLTEPAMAFLNSRRSLDANTFSTRNLVAPISLSASPVGHDVALSWPAGLNGNGYAVRGVANGSSSNCTGAVFASVASTGALSYTDTGRFTPQGTWFCYQVQTTYGTWSSASSNPSAAARLGVVASSVQTTNNGNHSGCSGVDPQQFGQVGTLDCGDQVIVTFNQAVNTGSGPSGSNTVCAKRSNNTIWLGSITTAGTCSTSETVNLGSSTGGTLGVCDCRYNATYVWSNGNQALTVTIGARVSGSGYATVSTSTWTFTPTTTATKLQSASGAFHICDNNGSGGACLPATSSPSTF